MQNDEEISALINNLFETGISRIFKKRENILGDEERPNGIHLITDGYVKAFTINDNGEECAIIIYGEGDIFPMPWAYLGVVDDSIYYQALNTTHTRRISRNWFLQYAHSIPELNFAISMQLARQFQSFSYRVDNLEYKKSYERVAYLLLSLYRRFGIRQGNKMLIDIPITHDLIASSINLTRETVSRQIEKLTQEHIISTAHHHIEIIDLPALTQKLS